MIKRRNERIKYTPVDESYNIVSGLSLSIPQPHHADLVFRVSSEKNIISTADTLGATISVAGRLSAEDLVELLRHLDEGDALF